MASAAYGFAGWVLLENRPDGHGVCFEKVAFQDPTSIAWRLALVAGIVVLHPPFPIASESTTVPDPTNSDHLRLQAEIRRLRGAVVLLGVALAACTSWLALRAPVLPPVISAERLEIREPDGNLAFVLANSVRPAVATLDGQIIMAGQEEERAGVPSFIFFDGKGDEVGGLLTGVQTLPDGYNAMRHLSLDGYKQDQTVVLAHYQSPDGSSAGLRISDRPRDRSLLDALRELGLEAGASREAVQAALEALPEEGRADRLRELFGVSRLFVGSAPDRSAALILRDGSGRPRIRIEVPEDGEPAIRILDESGSVVARFPPS